MEEFMKNPWFYIGGGIAFVCAASYIFYKRFFNVVIVEKDPASPIKCDLKKHIESLSYEYLVEEAKMMVSKLGPTKINDNSVLSLAVVPNKLALQFLAQPNSQEWLGDIEVTEDEKQRMVILSIKDTDKMLLSEILIADWITDDFYDFVPNDKIYVKKIVLKK